MEGAVTAVPPPEDRPDDDVVRDDDARATDAPEPWTLPLIGAVVLVAVGGVVGTACRYELELLAPARAGRFPWATFGINVSGSLVLGLLLTLLTSRWEGRPGAAAARPLLTTGFLGAFTTWSTYMVEVTLLAKDHAAGTAVAYLVASLVAGLLAATVGVALAGRRPGGRARGATVIR
jgi:CrcB protein